VIDVGIPLGPLAALLAVPVGGEVNGAQDLERRFHAAKIGAVTRSVKSAP